jgi:putative addiction module killer protein
LPRNEAKRAYDLRLVADPMDNKPSVLYVGQVVVLQTATFRAWLSDLRDRRARIRIDDRLLRLADGHVGDTKSVGHGVRELRLHFGPGYRVYYVWRGELLVLLLNGGGKNSQSRDIAKAKHLAREAEDGLESNSL